MSPAKTKRSITLAPGFRAAGGTCGIKPSGAPDLALIVADRPCSVAAVFTTNRMPGAPVIVSKRHVRNGRARAIVCNAGIANVATGQLGIRNAEKMCEQVAANIGCAPKDVLANSTGVIGKPLPITKILTGIDDLAARLDRGPGPDADAAGAILTTDLVPKAANRKAKISGKTVTLGGIAKGSGMIAPNMATMLVLITTDAAIEPAPLKAALKTAVAQSFNRINIDCDTSTSDSVQVLANGQAANRAIKTTTGAAFNAFAAALADLCKDLAYQIVKDGEGATKVYRVILTGARSQRDADKVGRTVAGSPLVKTAVHGGDPNWGRLIAAIGRSGAYLKPDKLDIAIGGNFVFRKGAPVELTKAQARRLDKLMAKDEVAFTVNLGVGADGCEWLGCDLSRDYIRINADYTT